MSLPVHTGCASLWVYTAVSCVTQASVFLGTGVQVTGTRATSPGLDEPKPQTPWVLMQEPRVRFLNALPTWEIVCVTGQLEMRGPVRWWGWLLVWLLWQASSSSTSFKAIGTTEASWVTEPSSLQAVCFYELFFSLPHKERAETAGYLSCTYVVVGTMSSVVTLDSWIETKEKNI